MLVFSSLQMVQNFQDESCFVISTLKGNYWCSYYMFLKIFSLFSGTKFFHKLNAGVLKRKLM